MTAPGTILKAWNLRAKKEFGQNFLSDPSTSEMIVNRAGIKTTDIVLEIGPGLGALTVLLARKAASVIAVEKDRDLPPLLRAELLAQGLDNVTVINQDVLRTDLKTIIGEVNQKVIVIGNLPYNISSQIVIRLIELRAQVDRAVFMFQKELAERLCASPGTKEYGRISVVLQYCADIRNLAEVKSHLFFPRPKVDSQVVEFAFKEPLHRADNELLFSHVVRAAFGKRRKTLKNALTTGDLTVSNEGIMKALEMSQIDFKRRAETLNVQEFVELSNRVGDMIKEETGGGSAL